MKRLRTALFLLCFLPAAAFGSDSIVEATSILERWTSFHWGRDCLVWLVHYPEELVEPWVTAEASRSGMSEAEKETYRRSFVSELRIENAEPFLLTVYAFGPRPLDIGSFASAVFLETSDGSRVPPLSYERKFDQPLSGIVQGLVFFPKQNDKNFAIVIRNLGIREEQRFAFRMSEEVMIAAAPPAESEVVVVELPPAPKKEPVRPRPPQPEPPEPPLPVQPAPLAPLPVATTQELAELKPEPVISLPPSPEENATAVLYVSKEKTVENFVSYWINGDMAAMYELLSETTRSALSEAQFARQVEATGLRSSLREGYRIRWESDDQVRVITAQRMLLFRTLRSKVLTLNRDDVRWKITW